MKFSQLLGFAVLGLLLLPAPVRAQALDCDLAQQPSQIIRTGQPFTMQACVASVVTTPEGDVPNRIDGVEVQIDTQAPYQAGKPTPGTPSPLLKLSAISIRSLVGVQKGNHQASLVMWNYPIDPATGLPNTAGQPQKAAPLIIPFVVSDAVLTGAPPPAVKGRVIR